MTKAKINKIIAVLAIIMLIMTSTVVFAADETATSGTSTYKVTMALDAGDSKLKEGSTVTVDVNITNIEGGSGLVDGISASLDYDKNVFESISETKEASGVKVGEFKSDNYKMASGWSITGNAINEQTGAFTLLGGAGQKAGKVMTLTFKVKDTIKVDSTTITLSAITATDSDNEVEVPTTRVTISREKKAETKTEPSINKKTPSTPKTTTTKNVADKTTAQKKIPKTGLSESGIAVIATIVIVGGICYVVYRKKYNDVK